MIAPLVFTPSSRPSLEGHFSEAAFTDRAEKLAAIWEFVKVLGGAPAGLVPPMEKLDEFLIAKGWAGQMLAYRYGAPAEASMNPCGK